VVCSDCMWTRPFRRPARRTSSRMRSVRSTNSVACVVTKSRRWLNASRPVTDAAADGGPARVVRPRPRTMPSRWPGRTRPGRPGARCRREAASRGRGKGRRSGEWSGARLGRGRGERGREGRGERGGGGEGRGVGEKPRAGGEAKGADEEGGGGRGAAAEARGPDAGLDRGGWEGELQSEKQTSELQSRF